MLKVFDLIEDKEMPKTIKDSLIFERFLGFDIDNMQLKKTIIDAIFDYLSRDKKSSGKKTIDLKKDYHLIWDSFLSKRGIDLNKQDIGWWEFQAIIEGLMLEGNCAISKVVEYRTMKIPKETKYNKEEIAFYRKMKQEYRLTDSHSVIDGMSMMGGFLKSNAKKVNK